MEHDFHTLPITSDPKEREHTREELKKTRPDWDDEKLDQLAMEIETWAEIILDTYYYSNSPNSGQEHSEPNES